MSLSVLTSCGKPNLEGKWEICNADGKEIGYTVQFKDDGTLRIHNEKEDYEVVNKNTIEIDGEEYDFEIIDKDEKLIYLGEFSDKKERIAINLLASNLMKSSNIALSDLDEEDKYYSRNAIICSDSGKNINAVPENADDDFDFAEYLKSFFSDINDYDYMIYIGNGACVYTAIKNPSGDIVGTYPSDEFEDMTFDEIYEEYKNNIE